jgi:hypothetical protein
MIKRNKEFNMIEEFGSIKEGRMTDADIKMFNLTKIRVCQHIVEASKSYPLEVVIGYLDIRYFGYYNHLKRTAIGTIFFENHLNRFFADSRIKEWGKSVDDDIIALSAIKYVTTAEAYKLVRQDALSPDWFNPRAISKILPIEVGQER